MYGTISFTDKLSSGVIIAIIQEMNPRTNMTYVADALSDTFYNSNRTEGSSIRSLFIIRMTKLDDKSCYKLIV